MRQAVLGTGLVLAPVAWFMGTSGIGSSNHAAAGRATRGDFAGVCPFEARPKSSLCLAEGWDPAFGGNASSGREASLCRARSIAETGQAARRTSGSSSS